MAKGDNRRSFPALRMRSEDEKQNSMTKHLTIHWNDVFMPTASILETIVRGTFVYLGLFALTRLVIRRRVGGIGVTNVLVMVLLADAVQNSMASELTSVTDGLVLVGTILFWEHGLDWLGYHVPALQRVMRAAPLVLVRDGQLLRQNMHKELVTTEELMNKLREQGLEDLSDVQQACLEGDGHISVIRRKNAQSEPPEGTHEQSLPTIA